MSAPQSAPGGDDPANFAGLLYDPEDVVEVRALLRGEARQEWCRARDLNDPESGVRLWIAGRVAEGWNIYVGANPRTRMGGSRAEEVALARAQFVDFDGIGPADAAGRIEREGLPAPTLLVASGHGAHAYWVLAEAITDLERWTGIQKRLIARLGTDPVVHDPPRIMRLPGTLNTKEDPAVPCRIVSIGEPVRDLGLEPVLSGERYLPPATRQQAARPVVDGIASGSPTPDNLARATLDFLAFGAAAGSRNNRLFQAACDLAGNGYEFAGALDLLLEPARRCGLEDWEIEATVRSACSRPRAPARPPRVRPSVGASGHDEGDEDGSDAGDPPGGPQRDRIVRLARERYRFGRSLTDEPFAVPLVGPNLARAFRGGRSSLRAELAHLYAAEHGSAPNASALADALLVLEGEAVRSAPEPVHLRLARQGEAIVLDLGDPDGRAVVIEAGGWRVVERSPVLFRRTALTAPLPVPARDGSLERLRELVNISGPAWPLAVGCLVAALIPEIEHPIVLLGGQQDAGKSTTARSMAGLIDPSTAPLRAPPRDLEQWGVTAVGSWVVVVDNISQIAEWLSDAMCRAVTGDGLVRRALYTDDVISVLVYQRCLILTSIDAGALKGDLGRRMVHLDLDPIDPRRKCPPAALKQRYTEALPGMLGGLLDLLVKVLAAVPSVRLDEFHGLADFEVVLAALDAVIGTDSLAQYRAQWERIAADVVEGDPVAQAVRDFAQRECQEGAWVGTAGRLLELLTPSPRPHGWPKNARALGGGLRRAIPVLKAVGVAVIPPDSGDKTRRYEVGLTARTARPPENAPAAVSSADAAGAVEGAAPPDRPRDRPSPNGVLDRASGEPGRSGGQGGASPHASNSKPPPSVADLERMWRAVDEAAGEDAP